MESIVQVVEGAVGAAEAEAKKIEAEVAGRVHAFIAKVETDAEAFSSDIERSRVVTELEDLVEKLRHPAAIVDAAAIQAAKDAEEDARVVEGSFRRFARRFWSWV